MHQALHTGVLLSTHMPLSTARRDVVQGTQDLWTLFADAAVKFEKSMSLLRGVYIDASQMQHDGELAVCHLIRFHRSCRS